MARTGRCTPVASRPTPRSTIPRRVAHEAEWQESTAWLATMLEPISVSQHYITNQVIGVTGDEGTCRAYFFGVVGNQSQSESSLIWVGGIYEDVLRRTEAGWRIAELVDISVWSAPGPGRDLTRSAGAPISGHPRARTRG